jgi:ABC-type sugar transport system permease subunit
MDFDIVCIMTRGGPRQATTVLCWIAYLTSFQFLRFGEGAAILYPLTEAIFRVRPSRSGSFGEFHLSGQE